MNLICFKCGQELQANTSCEADCYSCGAKYLLSPSNGQIIDTFPIEIGSMYFNKYRITIYMV
jgi:DNA-directed RNA polymerase subunit RPC12/RpoP